MITNVSYFNLSLSSSIIIIWNSRKTERNKRIHLVIPMLGLGEGEEESTSGLKSLTLVRRARTTGQPRQ